MSENLLISEPPLQVLPSLATKVGLNEAIVLQQIHYWLLKSKNVKDGHKWVYNSYTKWNEQFPFWGRNTMIRAFHSLEKQGILITGNYNKAGFDKTKWYRINYEKLMGKRCTQNGYTKSPKWLDGDTQNGQTYTNRLPETTTDIEEEDRQSSYVKLINSYSKLTSTQINKVDVSRAVNLMMQLPDEIAKEMVNNALFAENKRDAISYLFKVLKTAIKARKRNSQ